MSCEKFRNTGLVFSQIGFEVASYPGKCKFYSISKEHTQFQVSSMNDKDILSVADNFTESDHLFSLALIVMHDFDFERGLHVVQIVRSRIPAQTQIVINIGDFNLTQAEELKAAGVNGAYLLHPLREGIDTTLNPRPGNGPWGIINRRG